MPFSLSSVDVVVGLLLLHSGVGGREARERTLMPEWDRIAFLEMERISSHFPPVSTVKAKDQTNICRGEEKGAFASHVSQRGPKMPAYFAPYRWGT